MRSLFAIFGATIVAVAACGARTGLLVDEIHQETDAGPDAEDAGPDAFDAPPDVVDAPPDAPPPLNECADAGTTYIYVMTEENLLFRFYPPDKTFVEIGPIACPTSATPFSMAVDRKGAAYVVFTPSGELFEVSTKTAACKPTTFQMGQQGFTATFGMGFSSNDGDPGETLYLAGEGAGAQLATLDPATFQLQVEGPFTPQIGNAELTGTGNAELFGFGLDQAAGVVHLAQIQKTDGQILKDTLVDLGVNAASISAWAFAYWGGDFYFFTSTTHGLSEVTQVHAGDAKGTLYATLGATIVGAGVSTCAPQQ